MQSNLIRTTTHAQAVYSAMVALDNIGADAKVHARFPVDGSMLHVVERNDGEIEAWISGSGEVETHADRAAFATAYGLDAPDRKYLLVGLWDDGTRWADSFPAASSEDAEAQALEQYPGVQIAAAIQLVNGAIEVVA